MEALTKRQRRVLDFLRDYIERRGYAPTLGEIGRHFGLRSPATVHKHLQRLEQKGAVRRRWNHSRAIELLPEEGTSRAFHLPLNGKLEGGRPVEMRVAAETVPVPAGLVGEHRTYVLRVSGNSFEDALIGDGDLVVIEECSNLEDGELGLVLLRGHEPCVRRYRRQGELACLESRSLPPLVFHPRDLRVRGRVLGILRRYETSTPSPPRAD